LLGHQILDQLGGFGRQVIEQSLCLLAPEQFRGMGKDHVVEMRGDHRASIDHGVAEHMGLLAQYCLDPDRRQAEGRILGRIARECAGYPPRIDGQKLAGIGLALSDR
jgi:HD superfamily phosphodiesterase